MRKRHLSLPAGAVRGVVLALAIGALVCVLAGCGGSGHGSGSATTTTTTALAGVAGSGASTSTTATPAAKGHTVTTGSSDGDVVRHQTHAGKTSATSGTGAGAAVGDHGTIGGAQHGSGAGAGAGGGSAGDSHGAGGHEVGSAGKPAGGSSKPASGSSKPASGSSKPASGSSKPASGSSPASTGDSGAPNAANGVPYEVHTAAMEPTYKPFSTVYYVPTQMHPQVGQVILYYLPAGAEEGTCASPEVGGRACAVPTPGLSHTLSLARVVGLAGEQIAIVNGLVVRNGQPVSEPSIQPCGEKELADEPGCEYPKAITVPAESYYVIADNRLLFQDDSRGFGAVPQAAVVGTLLGS
jgi:signal peptidase I